MVSISSNRLGAVISGQSLMAIFSAMIMALVVALSPAAQAHHEETPDTALRVLVDDLAKGKLKKRLNKVKALAATEDARVVPVLKALQAGTLFYKRSDKKVFMTAKAADGQYQLTDPLNGSDQGVVGKRSLKKVKTNNRIRREIAGMIAQLTLFSSDEETRRTAAAQMAEKASAADLPLLVRALTLEKNDDIRALLEQARAAAILAAADAGQADKLAAIDLLARSGGARALARLTPAMSDTDAIVADRAKGAVAAINKELAFRDTIQSIWYGISLGSVLLLAAIGLAITFGVMGVINMAHGEMVMLGAYTTFVVQTLILSSAPALAPYALAFALPAAFLVSGTVGLLLERGVIRFLYGRPLETLLATWGVSLVLQQLVRSLFGPTNKEVSNPSWMSGAFDLMGLTITYNRLWIVLFALAVFLVLLVVLKRTSFGLKMRAVTQNRGMAASMGIRTPWVDALTFALGSGIAGMAGVALSQIDNVSPNLGQNYIIDSFMVVVFGGVGNLWGTLIGALSLGVANKFLEPFAGAVLAKIVLLVLIILFIQKRPRGLFAQKGRAVEA